jgi:hypothetical protein
MDESCVCEKIAVDIIVFFLDKERNYSYETYVCYERMRNEKKNLQRLYLTLFPSMSPMDDASYPIISGELSF